MGGGSGGGAAAPVVTTPSQPAQNIKPGAAPAGAETLLTARSPNTGTIMFRGKEQSYRTNLALPDTAPGVQASDLLYKQNLGGSEAARAGDTTSDINDPPGVDPRNP